MQNIHDAPAEPDSDLTSQNIQAILKYNLQEEQKISGSQRILERIGGFVGQPVFLTVILLFVTLWVSINTLLHQFGIAEFDPTPFHLLQGLIGLGALITTTVVLTKQNRLARLDERRSHLDLKVMLLTEQKTTKLINLLEELRRDLPNVKNRHDAEAATLQESMNTDSVIATLDEGRHAADQEKPSDEPATKITTPSRAKKKS
jgi:uncharacterized membrane protein